MSLQNILDKILADAAEKAEKIISDAKVRAEKITEKTKIDAEKVREEIAKRGEQKIAAMHRKVENLIAHREKSEMLAAKREILKSALDAAKTAIARKSPEKKEKLFLAMFSQIDAEKGEIRPVAADTEILKKAISKAKKNFSIGSEVSGSSGFVFVSPDFEMDFRVDEILEKILAPALEEKLSQILF